ncbi:hypothetical protein ACYSNW_10760 [Enterococcus sp. LJL99]
MLKKTRTIQVPSKRVLTLTIIFILAIIGMNIAAAQLNESILDFRINYTSADAYHFFQHLGDDGRHFYFILLLFDLLFPIIYMLFGVNLALFMINKQENFQNWQTIFVFFPIFGMICDWIENALILSMLHSYDASFLKLAAYSSKVTLLKFSFLGIFISWLIIIAIKNLINKKPA